MNRILRRCFGFIAALVGWVVSLAVVLGLAFSYLLPQDLSRTTEAYGKLVQVAFFGRVFTFHIALLLAVIGGMAALLRRWRLTTLVMVPATIVLLPADGACLPKHPAPVVGPMVRIMSANLKYVDRDGDLIASQIREYNPAVLVLQDYTPFSQDAIDSELAHDYPYRKMVPNYGQGLAIYSRLPFVDGPPKTLFNKLHRQMRVVIGIKGRPVALYIVHPFSPRTRQRILVNRLETLELADQIRQEKIPVMLAGDFNFTAATPNETALKALGLQDAFGLAGLGRGSTWPARPTYLQWLPGVRIDHVFVSRTLTCTRFEVGKYDGSDHLPIVADVGFAAAP